MNTSENFLGLTSYSLQIYLQAHLKVEEDTAVRRKNKKEVEREIIEAIQILPPVPKLQDRE